jgi:glyoxylase-like metal-dependent hydrolase (beta-lactamase superfamily II)
MIDLKAYNVSIMATNCYLLIDKDTKALALVDPGEYTSEVLNAIMENGGDLRLILLTHGHYDHIGGVSKFLEKFPNAKVYIGKNDAICLTNDDYNLSVKAFQRRFKHFTADLLSEGDILELGNSKIKFIETPGHTIGSGCFIFDDKIITGDTLFYQSCGRTDFINSSSAQMIKSLKKLSEIQGEYKVYPGHGDFSSLSFEKSNNPYMNYNYEDIY